MKILISAIIVILLLSATLCAAQTIPQQLKEKVSRLEFSQRGQHMLKHKPGKKSVKKAVVLSMLVPGLGQAYLGNTTRMYPYLGIEAVTWSVYGVYKNFSNLREDDYKLYAATYADADIDGKDSDYFSHIEDFMSSDDYNEDALREYRLNMYPGEPKLYLDSDGWNWESDIAYEKYKDLRHDSWLADKKATYTLGFAVLNRIVSAIDAAKQTKVFNRDNKKSSWNVKIEPVASLDNYGGTIIFNYKR